MVIISNNPKFILNTTIVNIAENYKTNHSNTKGGTLMFYLEHESQAFKAIEQIKLNQFTNPLNQFQGKTITILQGAIFQFGILLLNQHNFSFS